MQQWCVQRSFCKKVLATAKIAVERHDDLLAQGIDWWICNLCKALMEVIRERTRMT